MKKVFITIVFFFPFLFCITFIDFSSAQQCNIINVPTLPKEYTDLPNCTCIKAKPTIVASSGEIAPGGSITLHVDSGGLACPPYTWSVNAPYSIDTETDNDLDEVTLTAPAGACGGVYNDSNVVATVTVADQCGETNQVKIRCTAGDWQFCNAPECPESALSCNGPSYETCENIFGDKKYVIYWYGSGSYSIVSCSLGDSDPKNYCTDGECHEDFWLDTSGKYGSCQDLFECKDDNGFECFLRLKADSNHSRKYLSNINVYKWGCP